MSGLRDPWINLLTWKVSTLARLSALGHFNLYLSSTYEILTCYAESSARYLLDS